MNHQKVLVMIPCRQGDQQKFLEAAPDFSFLFSENPSAQDFQDVQVIIGRPSFAQLADAKNLKWLQISFAGADYYTGRAEFPGDVILTNVSGAFGQAISEYVLAMIFSLYKKLPVYRDQQNEEIWQDAGRERSLAGKTVLIVGAGDIGSSIAVLTKKFDCCNIGIRRVQRETPQYLDEVHTLEKLDELLPRADIVTLSLPSTRQTRGLFSEKRIKLMKPDALLVNVGRGDAVDTQALCEALQSGRLGGAALDVTNPEPLPKGHPLWHCRNAIITPHITGSSFDHLSATQDKITEICAENLRRYSKGESLLNQVDFSTGYRKTQI